MSFYLIHPKNGKALSQFVGNDKTPNAKQLYFRKNDWYCYSTIEEAQKHKDYIIREANDRVKKVASRLIISPDKWR